MTDRTDRNEVWLAQRARLIAIAYNILGSWSDAEDAASEAWLRLQKQELLDDAAAWLTVVTSRIALDTATSAEHARTDYVGPWLPEIVTLPGAGPDERVVLGEAVDLALVRLVQNLVPVDRVIVVLADVFDVPFSTIAKVVDSTPSATRQRASRARRSLAEAEGVGVSSRVISEGALNQLAVALGDGDLNALTKLLSDGCVLWTDSGGHTKAARRAVYGADKVRRFLAGIISKYGMPELAVEVVVGGHAIRATSPDMVRMIVVEASESGEITGLQIQQNPEKMRFHRLEA